jgi:hypothetical protein
MNRRGFVLPVVIAIVALAAIGGALAWRTSYLDSLLPAAVINFFGRSADSANSAHPQPEPSSEESEPTASDVTKDWKTYTNKKAGISFKYPKDWAVEENDDWDNSGLGWVVTASSSAGPELTFYTNFHGGFEYYEVISTKTLKLGSGEEVEIKVHKEIALEPGDVIENPNGRLVLAHFQGIEPYGFLMYVFDKSVSPDALSLLETILSTFRIL